MTNWAAIDVAIGIVVVYFVLSLVASTLNETIASALGWRSSFLESWLKNVLTDGKSRQEAETKIDAFFAHPLLAVAARGFGFGRFRHRSKSQEAGAGWVAAAARSWDRRVSTRAMSLRKTRRRAGFSSWLLACCKRRLNISWRRSRPLAVNSVVVMSLRLDIFMAVGG